MDLRTRVLAGLFMLLAAAPEARSQTAQSALPTGQVAVRKMGKSGNNGSLRSSGATAGTLPGLCFQPGVGWHRVLTKQPDESVLRDLNAGPNEHGSAGGANPPLVSPRSSRIKQTQSVECPEVLTDKKVTGAGVENFTILSHSRTLRSAGATNPGSLTSLQIHSPNYSNGNAGLGTVPSPIPSSPIDSATEDGPVSRPNQIGDRAFHAYLSSVKLRRLIRNTPDLQSRIKLQQLQIQLTVPSHHILKQLASRTSKGERLARTSSRRSRPQSRPQGNSRSLGVGP